MKMSIETRTIMDVMPAGQNTRMIFYFLQSLNTHEGVPWKSENIQVYLDTDYTMAVSGSKIISPLVSRILGDSATLTTQQYQQLANIIWMRCWKRWHHLWELYYVAEYAPLQNYDMTETESGTLDRTYGKTHTRTDDLEDETTHGMTRTRTDNLQHGRTDSSTTTPAITEASKVYGFNSATPSGDSETTRTGTETVSGTSTDTDTGTVTDADSGTDTVTRTGTVTDEDGGTDSDEHSRTLTRSGNIGVTSSQDLIMQDMKVWQWMYFQDVVYHDLDVLLTIPIY